MCERFVRNREKLVNLMCTLKRFDEKKIIETFRKRQNGDTVIDGSQTITQYLEDLREHGLLKYSSGVYSIPKTFKFY
jgi:hypothetical protein